MATLVSESLIYPSNEEAKCYLSIARQQLRLAIDIATGYCQLRKHLQYENSLSRRGEQALAFRIVTKVSKISSER
ncbi:unnamed protein product [Acanthoscelides obtectus]|uniref:Uncharacterized protein n=1 Tax=Acanthoscelides obtectus TaxID=200917 RepID=A0A9P0K785_ACAOB|nr:unnamed protein product [Acanthoscelides obtectus]CAK1628486.1 hypothetical protein AOBTE_LOCUS5240 [Acanthoscelides obtectus]